MSLRAWLLCVLSLAGMLAAAQAQNRRVPDPGYTKEQVLKALDALAPLGVDLDAIQVENATAEVSGVAEDTVVLSHFIRAVDLTEHFGTPELLEVANDAGRSAFSLKIAIQCPSGIAGKGDVLCGEPGTRPTKVYKCRINGSITFQGTPCPPGKDA